MRTIAALGKSVTVLGYLLFTALMLHILKGEKRIAFKRWVTRTANRILDIKVTLQGTFVDGPALIVSNHSSYLDIIILQSLAEMAFTPKIEMKRWPLIGTITDQFNAIYVDRKAGRTQDLTAELLERLREGARLCVFPEATTNDGRSIKPFKSSLFALAETWDGMLPLAVQPVSIRYERINGKPLDDTTWSDVAWYGDDTLVGHLWRLFHHRDLKVSVICHPPLTLGPDGRKGLCRSAETVIRSTVLSSPEPVT